ncbi:MAG: efflux RND transporter periplasmic adaptor subunit [Betaproteobacteria bacterium]|jgi:RND family efflux transporter MFP subunit|nr:efflux RND transporter periplasmic adaptor subunit [Burkholderiales bacterium]NBX13763.1 efflux RND transporter periplasmic adaptor subunit [Betaproteobacteria bacterium]NBX91099.1 efflux RND transporter periplasmic adaptor subunit [Betaproteobacteria bacterium]
MYIAPHPCISQATSHVQISSPQLRPTKDIFAWVLIGAALIVALAGCSKKENAAEPVRAVKIISVGYTALNVQGDYAAEVKARVETRLSFRVAGKLLQRQAEVGQRVKAGDVLAQVDVQDYELAAQAAQAQAIGAQTQRDLAAADFKRYEALLAQNFISSADLERRAATLKGAQASLDQAKAQAQAQSNQASYARLMASAAGIVTAVEAEPGQVLAAGQTVLRLAHEGPRDAVFAVPEQLVGRLHLGQAMTATSSQAGPVYSGRVREIAASADPVTRTFAVKLALEKAQTLPLGVTLNVQASSLQGSQPEVIKVPTSALRQEGANTAVWVLDSQTMTVALQVVEVATAQGNDVVIASGLKPGQQVVVAGVHVLSPGQKVTVFNAPSNALTNTPAASPTVSK